MVTLMLCDKTNDSISEVNERRLDEMISILNTILKTPVKDSLNPTFKVNICMKDEYAEAKITYEYNGLSNSLNLQEYNLLKLVMQISPNIRDYKSFIINKLITQFLAEFYKILAFGQSIINIGNIIIGEVPINQTHPIDVNSETIRSLILKTQDDKVS